jgi:hypothetical protein
MLPDAPQFYRGCQRRFQRSRPEHAERAFLHFGGAGGARRTMSLVEISEGGVGFGVDDEGPSFEIGDAFEGVTIQVGACAIAGSLRVAHLTSSFAAGTVCGAAFTPASEADAQAMAALLAGLDKRKPASD